MVLTNNTGAPDLFSLKGKVAIVTGASRGVGEALAFGLAEYGATVIRLGRSHIPQRSDEGRVHYQVCDVTDESGLQAVMQQAFDKYGRIDILVNAAGISLPPSSEGSETDRFNQTVQVNLQGAYSACMLAIPYMKKTAQGSIINISSINSQLGFPGNPGYVASKGGISALSRALAVDYGVDNIRVNTIAPGYIHTAMTEKSYNDPSLYKDRLSHMVLPRWGDPIDIVGTCVFLASQASAYMTGQELFVDGGWSIKGL
ncbi:MAG: SDR family oxidoreductase [Methylocystaceae bacterium]|nr:SDR family oxidoreductase [Methylocystaceae bacterium]